MKIRFEFDGRHYSSLDKPIIIDSVNIQTALIKLALEIDLSDINAIYIDEIGEGDYYEKK